MTYALYEIKNINEQNELYCSKVIRQLLKVGLSDLWLGHFNKIVRKFSLQDWTTCKWHDQMQCIVQTKNGFEYQKRNLGGQFWKSE